jgi:hypothetical protein
MDVRWRSSRGIKAEIMFRAAFILLVLFLAQCAYFITANSETFDESPHIAAGYSYLVTRDFRLDREHPPLAKIAQALPLFLFYRLPFNPDPQKWRVHDSIAIGDDFIYGSPFPADQIVTLCRLPNLLFGGLLILLIGWWAHRLWGGSAAIFAMALGCFEPNFIAHSSLVTNDIGVALFMFSTLYLLWEYVKSPTWWRLAATGVSLGLALVTKYSALILLPVLALIAGSCFVIDGGPCLLFPARTTQTDQRQARILETVAMLCVILLFALPVIPAAYLFQDWSDWIKGLQTFVRHAEAGHGAFFLGQYSYDGWWNYFIVAFLIKTPIGSLLLIAASLFFFSAGKPLRCREAIFLLLPVVVLFAVTTQAKVNIGLRHVLAVYPFLFVIASRAATIQFGRRWLATIVIAGMAVFTAVSSLAVAPHQLAYFNEFVGGPGEGYRYLSDSNLDWGQDLKGLKQYVDKENLPIIYLSYFGVAPPEYYGIRYQYVPGTWPLRWPPTTDKVPAAAPRKVLAISVYNLQDTGRIDDPLFRWLWTRSPVAKIGYSIFIYDLTNDPEGLRELEATYVKAGIPELR